MKLADDIRDGGTRHDAWNDAEQRLQRLLREIALSGREKQRQCHENRQRQHDLPGNGDKPDDNP